MSPFRIAAIILLALIGVIIACVIFIEKSDPNLEYYQFCLKARPYSQCELPWQQDFIRVNYSVSACLERVRFECMHEAGFMSDQEYEKQIVWLKEARS